MSFVFRPKRRVNGKVRVGRTYMGQFRLAGDLKPRRVPLGVSDKQVAKEKLSRIEREAEREREGLILPKEHRDAAKQSVESHVQEFAESRRGLNRDEKYVRDLERKLFRLIRECEWSTLRDVTPHSFEAWRARQSELGKDVERVSRCDFRFVRLARKSGRQERDSVSGKGGDVR
jgi:hypothetical protein